MRRSLHLFFSLALAVQLQAQYTTAGTDSTFDVLTWNIENFPKNGSNTVSEVADIVSALQVDAIAVQEIASVSDFNALLNQLPGWSGILSSHEYGPGNYQKVGLLYDAQKVTVDGYQLLFEDDTYAFPRPPMEFFMSAAEGDYWFDLRMIVVHLKAFGGEENEARRRAAIESLKVYIDEEMQSGDEPDFILLGDFNDHLEDPPEDNVFTVMLEDAENYTFLTEPLAGIQGSYIGLNEPNLIDHICITVDALNEYGQAGSTQVLYLDDQNPDYETTVSDHRPVFAQFAFDTQEITAIRDIHEHFESYEGQVVTIRGVVTLGAGILSTTYTSAYVQDTSQAGIYIYYSSGIISDLTQGTQVELSGQVYNYNGLHEIIYQSHRVTGLNQPLPDPFAISTNSINNTDENPGRWIEVQGTIESISGTSNITMMINDGSGAGKVFFDADAGFDLAEFSVGEQIKITGVKTVYNYEGEVVPGYQEDIQKVNPSPVWERVTGPAESYLYPNYPNPFNSITVISYQLPVRRPDGSAISNVDLSIYNLLGQKVVTLVSGRQAAGHYTVQWDAADQAGGVYIIRLETGDGFVQSRKMLLLK